MSTMYVPPAAAKTLAPVKVPAVQVAAPSKTILPVLVFSTLPRFASAVPSVIEKPTVLLNVKVPVPLFVMSFAPMVIAPAKVAFPLVPVTPPSVIALLSVTVVPAVLLTVNTPVP